MYRFLSLQFRVFSLRKPPISCAAQYQRSYRGKERSKSYEKGWRWQRWKSFQGAGAPLFAFSWMTTFKNFFGIPPFAIDDDPLKMKIREAWLLRREHRYSEALGVLEEAMSLAKKRNDEMVLSRVIDEQANTYFEMGRNDEAEELFRVLIQRLIHFHKKGDDSPEFIEVSLKLSDIFSQKGKYDDAEIGYKHCVMKQMQVVDQHMTKYALRYGGRHDIPQVINEYGTVFTDPLALYGMCLERYAHFLVIFRGEKRLADSTQLMDEALKISHQIYGINCYHTMNMLNNYGALLILRNRFELAKKYLAIGIDRILFINECSAILPGYYCNYAEALFHSGEKDEAVKYARKAAELARSEKKETQEYTANFLRDVEREYRRRG